MSAVVLDASAAIALIVESQETEASIAFGRQMPPTLTVPAIFAVEVRHALLKLERRRVIPDHSYGAALEDLEAALTFADWPSTQALRRVMSQARTWGLGYFEALYLDLAEQSGGVVVTRDGGMIAAADLAGVPVIDLR
jgi:predicted nucleic acid-binding protein